MLRVRVSVVVRVVLATKAAGVTVVVGVTYRTSVFDHSLENAKSRRKGQTYTDSIPNSPGN